MMNKLINNRFTNENEVIQKATRDGTEVEKGVVLTKDYIERHEKEISELMDIYIAYPDLYLDTITLLLNTSCLII